MTDNPSLRKAIYVLKAPIVRKIGLKIRHFRCLDKFAASKITLTPAKNTLLQCVCEICYT